jgi:hypothetical protein
MNVLVSKKGLLLQASAGNGKTYTAKMIAKTLEKGVKILAPTNKAALNIGGSTIHKFLKNDQGRVHITETIETRQGKIPVYYCS